MLLLLMMMMMMMMMMMLLLLLLLLRMLAAARASPFPAKTPDLPLQPQPQQPPPYTTPCTPPCTPPPCSCRSNWLKARAHVAQPSPAHVTCSNKAREKKKPKQQGWHTKPTHFTEQLR